MLKFNKKLTALTLLTVTSVAGAMLNISSASAQPKPPDVILFEGKEERSFGSNQAVADLSKVAFDNIASRARVNNNQKWRFYEDKNFQGKSVLVEPGQSRSLSGIKVSSFRAVSN
jgi:hypothetical protein